MKKFTRVALYVSASALFALPLVSFATATPSVNSFTISPSSIYNAYSASVAWNVLNGGAEEITFTCPTGVRITREGSDFPCNSRQSLSSSAVGSAGFTFINVAGVPRTVTARLYPKDSYGVSYDSAYAEASITVESAFVTISAFTSSMQTISSGSSVALSWESLYVGGTNMRFDCAAHIRVLDENGVQLPCGTPAFPSDLPISGSKTVSIINDDPSNSAAVSINMLPAITAGLYNGSAGKQVGITVTPKPAMPDPVITSFKASATTVTSGGAVQFAFAVTNATSTNFQFSCADVVIASGGTTLACNTPAFATPLGASSNAFPVTFTNRTYSPQTVRVMFLAQKANGSYFYGSNAQMAEITVLPIGQTMMPTVTAVSTSSIAVVQAPPQTSSSAATSNAYKFTAALRRGIKHPDVSALQTFLAKDKAIYPEGLVTGTFGAATEAALKRFQKRYGIEQTGTVGPATRAKLNSLSKP